MKLILDNLLGILTITVVVFVNSSFQSSSNNVQSILIEYTAQQAKISNYYKSYEQIIRNQTKLMSKFVKQMNKLRKENEKLITENKVYLDNLNSEIQNTKHIKETLQKQLEKTDSELKNFTSRVELLQSQIDSQKKGEHNYCPSHDHSTGHMKTLQFPLPCDTDTDEQVWSIIERRKTFAENFNRSWIEYADGFGDNTTDFFIGLTLLHFITSQQPHELLIRMQLRDKSQEARYSHFVIGSESEAFVLKSLGIYSGNAGDGMRGNENHKFSTYDRDHDTYEDGNCAADEGGGWWYLNCGLK